MTHEEFTEYLKLYRKLLKLNVKIVDIDNEQVEVQYDDLGGGRFWAYDENAARFISELQEA